MIRLNASTSAARHTVVAAAHQALQSAGASVTDFHQFSNVSVAIAFEIPTSRAADLALLLGNAGIALTQASLNEIASLPQSAAVVPGSLQITFFHSEPDLRIPVPAIPG